MYLWRRTRTAVVGERSGKPRRPRGSAFSKKYLSVYGLNLNSCKINNQYITPQCAAFHCEKNPSLFQKMFLTHAAVAQWRVKVYCYDFGFIGNMQYLPDLPECRWSKILNVIENWMVYIVFVFSLHACRLIYLFLCN